MRKFYFLLIVFQGFCAMENRHNHNQKDQDVEMINTSSMGPMVHGKVTVATQIEEEFYNNELDTIEKIFSNGLFPTMNYDEKITPNLIFQQNVDRLNGNLDGLMDENSPETLKKTIENIKSEIKKKHDNFKKSMSKAQLDNGKLPINPDHSLELDDILAPLKSLGLINIINEVKSTTFSKIDLIERLENDLIDQCTLINQRSGNKDCGNLYRTPAMEKRINSTEKINPHFVEQNLNMPTFNSIESFTYVGHNRSVEIGINSLCVPNKKKISMVSFKKHNPLLIKAINDFFQTTVKDLFFLFNWSRNLLNRISPEFNIYFSILDQIYSDPLLSKIFFTMVQLSDIEDGKKAFNWRKNYIKFCREGNGEEAIDGLLKFGFSTTATNKLQQDKQMLKNFLDGKNHFKNLINGEGTVVKFLQGEFKKKEVLPVMINFVKELMGKETVRSRQGFCEKLFAGIYSIDSTNSNDLFKNIHFTLPTVKDKNQIKEKSPFKKLLTEPKNPKDKISINRIRYYLLRDNRYIHDNFYWGNSLMQLKKNLDNRAVDPYPKSSQIASHYKDFLILFKKKFCKAIDKVNHLKNAKLSPRNDRIFDNPNDEKMAQKLIKFLDIASLNPFLAFISFLQSYEIEFVDIKEMPEVIDLKTFSRQAFENRNRNIQSLYNLLEEQMVAQKQKINFAFMDFLMLFILRPDWVKKQEILLQYYVYLHYHEAELSKFEKMNSKIYYRFFIDKEKRLTEWDLLDNKSDVSLNLRKIIFAMGQYFVHQGHDDSMLSMGTCLDEKVYESGLTSYINMGYTSVQQNAGLIHQNTKRTNYDFQTNDNILYKCVQNYSNNFSLINDNPLMFTSGFTNVLLNHHMDLFIKLLHYSFQRNNEGVGCFKENFENVGRHFNFANIEVYNQIQKLSHLIALVLNHCVSIDAKYFPQWEQLIDFNTFFKDEWEQQEFMGHYSQDGKTKKSLCVIMYLLSYFQEKHQLNYFHRAVSMIDLSNYQKKSISPLLEPSFSTMVNFFMLQNILKAWQSLDVAPSSLDNPQKIRTDLNNLSLVKNDLNCKYFMDQAMDYKKKLLNNFVFNFDFLKHITAHNPQSRNGLIFLFLWERQKKIQGHRRTSGFGTITNKFLWIDILELADMIPANYLTLPAEKIRFIEERTKTVELFYKQRTNNQ